MKNKYLKILLAIIVGILIIGMSTCFAVSVDLTKQETTDAYKRWQTLSQQEKQKYIEPQPYSLNLNDAVKMSVYNKLTKGVSLANIDTSYNLYNDVKFKVKDQKNTNECWAFATTTILETNVAKTRNKTIELSPRHINYATSRTFLDGINKKGYNREIGMGNFVISLSYCTSGNGPVYETDMPFEDNEEKVNLSEIDKEPVLKLEDYVAFPTILKKYEQDGTMKYTNGVSTEYTQTQVEGVRNLIKEHIKKYGGVTSYTYLAENLAECINLEKIQAGQVNTIAYYNKDSETLYNHAITIVGWDDNYSKENFNENNKPKNDGAYLVLNTSPGTNGILSAMYISYEDVWIEYGCYGVVSTSDIDYDTLYQYDEYGSNMILPLMNSATGKQATTGYIANVFSREEVEKEEYLKEVSINVSSTSNVEIYVNAESDDKTKLVKIATAGILETGYHTIKLSTPLKLTGNKFIIAAKLTSDAVSISTETNSLSNNLGSTFWDNATSEVGQSFISLDGSTWKDLNADIKDSNVCLKAFTIYQEEEDIKVTNITLDKESVEMQEGESFTLVTTLTPINATNKNIKWTTSDEKVATITNTGIITALKEGITTITATTEDGNKTATCIVTVKAKTNNDDDIYYENNIGDNTNKIENDSTVVAGTIPQTGIKITINLFIIIIISIIIANYIKMKKMKDIK